MGPDGSGASTRTNKLKATLSQGRPAFGTGCHIPSSFSAEILASLGFDFITVDMQHGLMDFGDAVSMLQAIAAHGPTPLVRIPVGDDATAQRLLDAGAEGIVFPMISTAVEARDAVAACRYAPIGKRSLGSVRSRIHLGADPHNADAQVMCIPMIETAEGVANLDAILSVPGVDAIALGAADLKLSLGIELDETDPRHQQAIEKVVDGCRRHGIPLNTSARTGAEAREAVRQGSLMVSFPSDSDILSGLLVVELAVAREDS